MGLRKRAVSEEQKQKRRDTILHEALQAFTEGTYSSVTIDNVAERSGIAKGTVYLYFKTKEELFLALNQQAQTDWFSVLAQRLQAEPSPTSIPRIVRLFAETLSQRPEFLRLTAILHTTLEQNVPRETWLDFKRTLREGFLQAGELLEQKLDFLNQGEGALFLVRVQALIIGLQHLASPPAHTADALKERELQMFRIDLPEALKETMTVLLIGLKSRK